MDDVYEISSILKESKISDSEKSDLHKRLKIILLDIQEEIENKEKNYNFEIDRKVENYKKLLDQIYEEICQNENIYNTHHLEHMFPSKINDINIAIRNKKEKFDRKKMEKEKIQEELNTLLKDKMDLADKHKDNKDKLEDKKLKLENNMEITAILEKKKRLIGNKKKNTLKAHQEVDKKDKFTQSLLVGIQKNTNNFEKKTNNEIESCNKILTKTLNSLKDLKPKSKIFKTKNTEISALNENINIYYKNIEENRKEANIKKDNLLKEFENYKNDIYKKNTLENNNIDEIINLLDEKFYELNDFFISIREENKKIQKELTKIDKEIKEKELKLFSIDINELELELIYLEKERTNIQDKCSHKYHTYKNKFDSMIDDLNLKKFRLENKISSLKSQKDNKEYLEELLSQKKIISQLLNGS